MSKLIKLATKFQRILAQLTSEEQQEYNAAHQPATQQMKDEVNEKIRQMISNPDTSDKANYDRDIAQAMKEWIAQHPNFTEVELDGAAEQWAQANIAKYDRRTELQKSKNLDEFGNLLSNTLQEQEFAQQDKDIQQFINKEQTDRAAQQKSIQGKTPFNTQDAAAIINGEINEIKRYVQKALKRKLVGDQKVMFIFYPNGNVGFVGQDIAMVNAIRRGFTTTIPLTVRSYMFNYKKYFTGEVKYEILL